MDSFELNKIAGAVLAALLTAFGMKTLFDVAAPTHKLDKPAYTVAVVRKDGGAPGAATPAFDPKPIVAAVKSASVEAGKDVQFKLYEGAGHAGESPSTPPEALTGNAADGRQVFLENCSGCHGANALGGNGGPTLADANDATRVQAQVRNGGGGMPAFRGVLTPQQIADVTAYVSTQVGP